MKNDRENWQYDLNKRVPIAFRVPVKKKKELLECAEKRGASVTDVLEVLTEDPEDKLRMLNEDFPLDDKKFNQILEYLNIELKNALRQIVHLEGELTEKGAENIKLLQDRWLYRYFLSHLQHKGVLPRFKTDIESLKHKMEKL